MSYLLPLWLRFLGTFVHSATQSSVLTFATAVESLCRVRIIDFPRDECTAFSAAATG